MNYLITGSAGFIGFSLSKKLLQEGNTVIGVDNLNNYYDPKLKKARLKILNEFTNFSFYKADVSNYKKMDKIFTDIKPDKVCHLAAQAGVRYSLTHPFIYEKSNMLGFLNILEIMRKHNLKNLVFASSSSIYGNIKKYPFKEDMNISSPISLYGATKAADELYAYVYHHLFGVNCIGLRFFTVYGPWGRPDMALFLFTDAILKNKPINVFNKGKMRRDFTYIDDIVDGIIKSLDRIEKIKWGIFNLGCSSPVNLLDFIKIIENKLGKKAIKQYLPIQGGDMTETFADIKSAKAVLKYNPKTNIDKGIAKFVNWYKGYYKSKLSNYHENIISLS